MASREQTPRGQFLVDAKLTQSYRLANPISGQKIAPLCDSGGVLHVFSRGSDGRLYDIVQDPASDTGWSSIDTHFSGSGVACFAAGIEPDGTTVVFVADNQKNYYYARDRRWGSQWHCFNNAGGEQTSDIRLGRDNGGGLLFTAKSDSGGDDHLHTYDYTKDNAAGVPIGNMYDGDGNELTKAIHDYQIGLDRSSGGANGVSTYLVGKCRKTAQGYPPFVEAGKSVPWTDGPDDFWAWDVSGGFSRLALAPSPSDPNDSAAFVIKTDDARLYHLDPDARTLVPIGGNVKLAEIAANLGPQGRLGVIALGHDQRLYHVHQHSTSPTGWTDMVALNDQIAFLSHATVADRDGNVVIFAVDIAHNLYRIWQDAATGDWSFEQIDAGKGPLQEIEAYSTQITVIDALGAASPDAPVEIWASGPTPASVNGRNVSFDATTPVVCRTNATGRLSVVVPADGLHTPALTIRADFMDPDEGLVIEPNSDIQEKLRALTAGDLLQARNVDDEPIAILSGEYNTPEVAQAIADAVNQTMAMAGAGDTRAAAAARRYVSPRTPTTRVRSVAMRDPGGAARIDLSTAPDAHWQIDFSSGLPVFKQMTRSEAVALMAARRAALPSAADGFGFDVDWGDVWSSVTETVTEIVDVVVTAVVDTVTNIVTEIQAQVRILIDKVEHVFDATIDFFEQAFDMVAGFFEKIAVAFKTLFEWLGFLFEWDDITRTADAVSHVFNVSLAFLSGAAGHVKGEVDGALDALSVFVDTGMDAFIDSFSGAQSIREALDPVVPPNPAFESRVSHNVLMQALMDNMGSQPTARPSRSAMSSAETLPPILQQLLDKLQQLADDFETGPGAQTFQEAVQYFEAIGNQPEQFLTLSLQGLLKLVESIALFAIQGIKALFDLLFDALSAAIDFVGSLFNEEWSIPLVSEIYKWATGRGLTFTPVGLFALAVAIPATPIYKAVKKAAPFPNDASLAAFKAGFTAAWLDERAWGTKVPAAAGTEPWLEVVRAASQIGYAVNFAGRALIETVINGSSVPVLPFVANLNVAQRYASSFLSMPWVMKDPTPNPSESEKLEYHMWYWQILAGPTRGAVVLAARSVDVDGRMGNGRLALWGAVHLGAVIYLAVLEEQEHKSDSIKTAENVLSCLAPQALKVVLLFPPGPVASIARVVYAVVTALSEGTIAVLHVARSFDESERARLGEPAATVGSVPVPAGA